MVDMAKLQNYQRSGEQHPVRKVDAIKKSSKTYQMQDDIYQPFVEVYKMTDAFSYQHTYRFKYYFDWLSEVPSESPTKLHLFSKKNNTYNGRQKNKH